MVSTHHSVLQMFVVLEKCSPEIAHKILTLLLKMAGVPRLRPLVDAAISQVCVVFSSFCLVIYPSLSHTHTHTYTPTGERCWRCVPMEPV
jgi:hypothetical protein